jgi:sulfur-carrier protein
VIRVILPAPLQVLAGCARELVLDLGEGATLAEVVARIEAMHPELRGTILESGTGRRRPFVRLFAAGEDHSHDSPVAPLPAEVRAGVEPLIVLGAMSGG